jgi:hypothetical protein
MSLYQTENMLLLFFLNQIENKVVLSHKTGNTVYRASFRMDGPS